MGIYVFCTREAVFSTLVPRYFQPIFFSLQFQFLILQLNPCSFLLLVTGTGYSGLWWLARAFSHDWEDNFEVRGQVVRLSAAFDIYVTSEKSLPLAPSSCSFLVGHVRTTYQEYWSLQRCEGKIGNACERIQDHHWPSVVLPGDSTMGAARMSEPGEALEIGSSLFWWLLDLGVEWGAEWTRRRDLHVQIASCNNSQRNVKCGTGNTVNNLVLTVYGVRWVLDLSGWPLGKLDKCLITML